MNAKIRSNVEIFAVGQTVVGRFDKHHKRIGTVTAVNIKRGTIDVRWLEQQHITHGFLANELEVNDE